MHIMLRVDVYYYKNFLNSCNGAAPALQWLNTHFCLGALEKKIYLTTWTFAMFRPLKTGHFFAILHFNSLLLRHIT